jgi:hypothetical protein
MIEWSRQHKELSPMKRFVLPLAALAALLVPTAPAVAAPTGAVPAAAHTDGTSKVPSELCLAVLGSDYERLVCSSG